MGWGEPQQGAREMLPRVVPLTLLLRYDRVSAGLTDKSFPTSLSRPVRWENECLFRRGDRNRNGGPPSGETFAAQVMARLRGARLSSAGDAPRPRGRWRSGSRRTRGAAAGR